VLFAKFTKGESPVTMKNIISLLIVLSVIYVLKVECRLPVSECTIIKDPAPLPKIGVVSANPERSLLIAQQYFDTYMTHTDFRGFQVYNGTYKGVTLFAANTGLGGPAAAFLVEELIAHDVEVIIRLGTTDFNTTIEDLHKVFILESVQGMVGVERDMGVHSKHWGLPIAADPDLVTLLASTALGLPNITAIVTKGYSIDEFYSFFDPTNVAENPSVVEAMEKKYVANGCQARDMESAAVLYLGQVRGIKTASVLQAVIKSGNHHEDPGTIGIPLVLETLRKLAQRDYSA